MALLAFRGMGNVKACVELLLKWEMVVMSMKCCSGFAVCVWLLEVLGVHGGIARVLEKGSVCSVWHLSMKIQLTAPTLCHFGGEWPLNKPKPSAPSSEKGGISSCFSSSSRSAAVSVPCKLSGSFFFTP